MPRRGSGIRGLLSNSMTTRSKSTGGSKSVLEKSLISSKPAQAQAQAQAQASPPGPAMNMGVDGVDSAHGAEGGPGPVPAPLPTPPWVANSPSTEQMSEQTSSGIVNLNPTPEASKLLSLFSRGKLIDEKDRGDVGALSDGMNSMFDLLRINYETLNSHILNTDKRFTNLDSKIDKACMEIRELGVVSSRHEKEIISLEANKASKDQVQSLSTELEALKSTVASSKSSINSFEDSISNMKELQEEQARLVEQHQIVLENLELSLRRVEREGRERNERLNVQEIRSRRLHLTIEGLPETKESPTIESIVTRINNDAEANLNAQVFASAYRVGKFNAKIHKKHPRAIRVRLRDDNARDALLACRGKLKPNPDKSQVWLNEELPDAFRRRKSMLRDLVRHINELETHSAYVERGGINLDCVYYGPDRFDRLPHDCQPARVRMIETDNNGLAFAGEWAPLSNMYRAELLYEGIQFSSSEQCYQYRKAKFHEDEEAEIDILLTNDPFECKRLGDNILEKPEWSNVMESIMEEVNRLKYLQNPMLYQALIETGERVLQEATIGDTWGINSNLRSKTTKDSSGTGQNLFGILLVKLRTEFRNSLNPTPEGTPALPV